MSKFLDSWEEPKFNLFFDDLFNETNSLFKKYSKSDNYYWKYNSDKSKVNLSLPFPGVDKENINITNDNDYVYIDVKTENTSQRETFYVCKGYDSSTLEAVYKNGLLTLTLSKEKEPEKKKIAIKD